MFAIASAWIVGISWKDRWIFFEDNLQIHIFIAIFEP